MQSLHRLLNRRIGIEPMNLQQIHIIRPQTLQARIHSIENGPTAQTAVIHIVFALRNLLPIHDTPDVRRLAHVTVAFAEDDELVPGNVELLDRLADDLFAYAVAVDVGGVPGVEAAVVGCFEKLESFVFFDDPGLPFLVAKAHSTEDGN